MQDASIALAATPAGGVPAPAAVLALDLGTTTGWALRTRERKVVSETVAVAVDDARLTWPERELVRQLGEKLYGKRTEARQHA